MERPEGVAAEGELEQLGDAAASLPGLGALPPDHLSRICANPLGFGSARKAGPSEWQIAILRNCHSPLRGEVFLGGLRHIGSAYRAPSEFPPSQLVEYLVSAAREAPF